MVKDKLRVNSFAWVKQNNKLELIKIVANNTVYQSKDKSEKIHLCLFPNGAAVWLPSGELREHPEQF